MSGYRLIKWMEEGILIGFELVPESSYQKVLKEDLSEWEDDPDSPGVKESLLAAVPLEGDDTDTILRLLGTGCGVCIFDELMTDLGI